MRVFNYIFILILLPLFSFAQVPATEVRAVWLTTNWGIDWPTQGATVKTQKEELKKILDRLEAENFNTILFQTRAQGGVFYRSNIEPLSPYFNHSENFDPLAFAVEECHNRGMECHAWITTYPMERVEYQNAKKGKKRQVSIINNKPDYYKPVGDRWYLDPGRPESIRRIVSVVQEIVSNYDVDGVHFDYIRYPNNDRKFPDEDTYLKYGNGADLYQWRRDNITKLVTEAYDLVKSTKPWVQISSSPLGRYKVLPEVSVNDGWTAYETVFQDAGYWMKSGKHDLVFPMMYYREQYFYPFLKDWIANSNGRIVVPGLGVYQMDEKNWSLKDILDQMKYVRSNKLQGAAYFRAGSLLNNLKGVKDSVHAYYPTLAKLPSLKWLDNIAPNSPLNLELSKDKNGLLNFKWNAPTTSEGFTYTIYVSHSEDIDMNDANNILATGLRKNEYSFLAREGEFGAYYAVTASDRFHNESVICFPAFFSHSSNEQ